MLLYKGVNFYVDLHVLHTLNTRKNAEIITWPAIQIIVRTSLGCKSVIVGDSTMEAIQ